LDGDTTDILLLANPCMLLPGAIFYSDFVIKITSSERKEDWIGYDNENLTTNPDLHIYI
jgi:hypothetical protein